MEDNDLLMMAAKAAGIEAGVIHQRPHRRCPEGWTPWNPLRDDGDALRLAAKLMLHIEWWPMAGSGAVAACTDTVKHSEPWRDDRTAAMRRAIVTAAAAVAGA